MTDPNLTLNPDASLASMAVTRAGASRVFNRYGLDFCCHGHTSLRDACKVAQLDSASLLDEIRAEERDSSAFERWDEQPLDALIQHLLDQFHEPHRAELPRLIEMARKVEKVHASKPACPHGLADHLALMLESLDLHMQKEEQVLFPLIRSGRGRMAIMPVQVMEIEHRDHGANLVLLHELAHDFDPPADACGTWSALYLGLAELERDLMQHIHLENNVLFPRALRS